MEDSQFEFDLATLALKGRRFEEAEKRYITLAKEKNNSVAWCGLGIAKFGQILDNNVTVEEIFFCFDKAKVVSPEDINSIEKIVLQTSYDVIVNLYSLFVNYHYLSIRANQQKANAFITGLIGGFLGGISNKSLYGTVAAAGFTAMSYSSYLKSNATIEEIKTHQNQINNIIKEIKQKASSFVELEQTELTRFKNLIAKLDSGVTDELKSEQKKKLMLKRKTMRN